MTSALDPRPLPPREPDLEECCGSGCDPCVFDRYHEAFERYREALAAWLERHPHERAVDQTDGRNYDVK
jgi:hypothetical protein